MPPYAPSPTIAGIAVIAQHVVPGRAVWEDHWVEEGQIGGRIRDSVPTAWVRVRG